MHLVVDEHEGIVRLLLRVVLEWVRVRAGAGARARVRDGVRDGVWVRFFFRASVLGSGSGEGEGAPR